MGANTRQSPPQSSHPSGHANCLPRGNGPGGTGDSGPCPGPGAPTATCHPQAQHPPLPQDTGPLLKYPPQRPTRQRDRAHPGPASGEPRACGPELLPPTLQPAPLLQEPDCYRGAGYFSLAPLDVIRLISFRAGHLCDATAPRLGTRLHAGGEDLPGHPAPRGRCAASKASVATTEGGTRRVTASLAPSPPAAGSASTPGGAARPRVCPSSRHGATPGLPPSPRPHFGGFRFPRQRGAETFAPQSR